MNEPGVDEESRCLELARGESTEAFSQLVLLHQVRVRGYIGRYLRQRDMVDDLAQEVFLDAFRRLHTYRGDASLASWLLGIARTSVLEYLRRDLRRQARESRGWESLRLGSRIGHVEADAGLLGERDREVSALQHCIQELPEQSARLVRQYYFESRSAAEIAREAGGNDGRIRMTLLRIRHVLRECMQRLLATEGGA